MRPAHRQRQRQQGGRRGYPQCVGVQQRHDRHGTAQQAGDHAARQGDPVGGATLIGRTPSGRIPGPWLRAGDPVNLAIWCASLIYLFVTEPPLYFPEWFGLDKIYGFIFAHNEFTVQFMYDRLPLYIVAFYPAIITLAYELVRGFGIFARRGAAVGALAVAFVAQVFYEIFDHLGPQLKWWAWNHDNVQVNHPMFASVPMNSMLLFASVSFGVMTFLPVYLQIAGLRARTGMLGFNLEDLVWGLFMNKYVFPGADASLCPSAMLKAMEKAGWETHSVENISIHYGYTIKHWHDNWLSNKEAVVKTYGERWFRIWHFFLAWSVIVAEQGNAACFQVVLNKNMDAFDRHRWVKKNSTILGDRANFSPSQVAAE